MHQLPTRSNVIAFLRKRAERAHARLSCLDRAEFNVAEIVNYMRALTDYSRENFRKAAAGEVRLPTAEEEAEILSRMEEIAGPPVPLPPEEEAIVKWMARDPKGFLRWAEGLRARQNDVDSNE